MQPDDLRLKDTQDWLARSDEDLRNAGHDLTAVPPFIRDALFHTQQAVEKACKGFLAWHDRPFRKIHNLEELGSLCAAVEDGLAGLAGQAAPLNKYAVRFRYPGEPYSPTIEEAREALALAGRIIEDILARLPGEVQRPRRPV
jgi:HEPN domain-containing protein